MAYQAYGTIQGYGCRAPGGANQWYGPKVTVPHEDEETLTITHATAQAICGRNFARCELCGPVNCLQESQTAVVCTCQVLVFLKAPIQALLLLFFPVAA
jgi:hypothetical protein